MDNKILFIGIIKNSRLSISEISAMTDVLKTAGCGETDFDLIQDERIVKGFIQASITDELTRSKIMTNAQALLLTQKDDQTCMALICENNETLAALHTKPFYTDYKPFAAKTSKKDITEEDAYVLHSTKQQGFIQTTPIGSIQVQAFDIPMCPSMPIQLMHIQLQPKGSCCGYNLASILVDPKDQEILITDSVANKQRTHKLKQIMKDDNITTHVFKNK